MGNRRKKLDAVALMRIERDRTSAAIEGMTLQEELVWLVSQPLDDPFLQRLRERAAQHYDPADMPSPTR